MSLLKKAAAGFGQSLSQIGEMSAKEQAEQRRMTFLENLRRDTTSMDREAAKTAEAGRYGKAYYDEKGNLRQDDNWTGKVDLLQGRASASTKASLDPRLKAEIDGIDNEMKMVSDRMKEMVPGDEQYARLKADLKILRDRRSNLLWGASGSEDPMGDLPPKAGDGTIPAPADELAHTDINVETLDAMQKEVDAGANREDVARNMSEQLEGVTYEAALKALRAAPAQPYETKGRRQSRKDKRTDAAAIARDELANEVPEMSREEREAWYQANKRHFSLIEQHTVMTQLGLTSANRKGRN